MRIPDTYLERLRSVGLLVSDVGPDGSVHVAKPIHVPGNCQPGRETRWGLHGDIVDTPTLWLSHRRDEWRVICHEYKPGPGPGDFCNRWDTCEEAVCDVIDFFFGDPSRMGAKLRTWAHLSREPPDFSAWDRDLAASRHHRGDDHEEVRFRRQRR